MPTMENRFRNFINTRRSRIVEVDAPIDTLGAPYQSSRSSTQQSTFLFGPRGKSQTETHNSGLNAMPLRSFSYESCQAGKLPTIGALPQKGNGPIKLQTSRRLSSGELINLPQDSQRTLEDIREDGYIVGKREKQNSPQQKQQSLISASRPHVDCASYSAPSLQAPFSLETWSQNTQALDEDLLNATQQSSASSLQPVGLGVFQPISRTYGSISEYRSYSSNNSISAGSIRSSVQRTQDSNATLKALRKAEYTKLVELYGSDSAAQNLAHYDSCLFDISFDSVNAGPPVFSPVILEPLPLPPIDVDNSRSSRSSSTSESLYSDSSSPFRASYVSSVATGQTSIEEDSSTTREDIRKMVEQMRNSYLSAIEIREPTPTKDSSRKLRKSKHASGTIPTSSGGYYRGSVLPPAPLIRNHGRQTWHPADADRDVRTQRRINSHPPSGFGRLSPIEASPPRKIKEESGLKRADSSTLGVSTASTTRAQIRSRSRTTSKHNTPASDQTIARRTESWLDIDSDRGVEARTASPTKIETQRYTESPDTNTRKDSEDFDELFSDELWSSTSSVFPIRPLSLCETLPNETRPMTPKRKISRITSIPESPEYTHLATTNDPENNFI